MIDPANATKDELLAMLKEREKDTAMLDWIDSNPDASLVYYKYTAIWEIVNSQGAFGNNWNLRAAIAAAMEAR